MHTHKHNSHREQQECGPHQVAEILDSTGASLWKEVSCIKKSEDTSARAIIVEDLKRIEWLNEPTWLKQARTELSERLNLVFASDEENSPLSGSILQVLALIPALELFVHIRYDFCVANLL